MWDNLYRYLVCMELLVDFRCQSVLSRMDYRKLQNKNIKVNSEVLILTQALTTRYENKFNYNFSFFTKITAHSEQVVMVVFSRYVEVQKIAGNSLFIAGQAYTF